jgi:hypothetical protein
VAVGAGFGSPLVWGDSSGVADLTEAPTVATANHAFVVFFYQLS